MLSTRRTWSVSAGVGVLGARYAAPCLVGWHQQGGGGRDLLLLGGGMYSPRGRGGGNAWTPLHGTTPRATALHGTVLQATALLRGLSHTPGAALVVPLHTAACHVSRVTCHGKCSALGRDVGLCRPCAGRAIAASTLRQIKPDSIVEQYALWQLVFSSFGPVRSCCVLHCGR